MALVGFDTTPFPFHGAVPGRDKPFMDVNDNGRLGHSSLRNGVLWEDQTYNERRVLLSIPKGFDPRRPSAVVVFLHGNEATLERDVSDRQGVARQLASRASTPCWWRRNSRSTPRIRAPAASGSRASSRIPERGGRHLAELYGTRDAEFVFDNAPVILVGYSGGYLPAAAALRYGGAGRRIRGVVLLDALYGEDDTFESFVEHRGSGFFVSLYGQSSRAGNEALRRRLQARGVPITNDSLNQTIAPGRRRLRRCG